MGARSKLKAASAGDKDGKHPHRVPWRQGEPATKGARPPLGTANARRASVAPRPAPGDARGEAPCIKKTKNLPLPAGKGDGGEKQAKGSVGRRQRRQAPPQGTVAAGRAGDQGGTPPTGHRQRSSSQCRAPSSPRGCKGRSPLHKKTKNLPLPRRGRGVGGWGQTNKLKAALAGGKEGKPPHRVPWQQGEPATKKASPPRGAANARRASAAPRPAPGDARGGAPCIKKLKIPPSRWEGGQGDGGEKAS